MLYRNSTEEIETGDRIRANNGKTLVLCRPIEYFHRDRYHNYGLVDERGQWWGEIIGDDAAVGMINEFVDLTLDELIDEKMEFLRD